ncbi:unnamed protein product [Linum tenue]|uniref:Uncharacterized protein n=1 Tax=Linum tenue TaxID=586396 RepID=A0AAV0NBZ7_9ROSI|nr:unnamed protein product [Linum tenue]
MIVISVNDQSA